MHSVFICYNTSMSFANPQKNIKELGLSAGMSVADIGCGTGHYVFESARLVGEEGEVFAVDIQKDLLDRLATEAEEKGFKNVHVLWGDAENVGGTKLRQGAVNAVIVSNVLFQAESKSGLVHEIKRILKQGGKLLLVDWAESFAGLGPSPQQVVPENIARELFENNGFSLLKTFDAGAHHYGFVFKHTA